MPPPIASQPKNASVRPAPRLPVQAPPKARPSEPSRCRRCIKLNARRVRWEARHQTG